MLNSGSLKQTKYYDYETHEYKLLPLVGPKVLHYLAFMDAASRKILELVGPMELHDVIALKTAPHVRQTSCMYEVLRVEVIAESCEPLPSTMVCQCDRCKEIESFYRNYDPKQDLSSYLPKNEVE